MAGVPMLAAVSAPSSLAVDLARSRRHAGRFLRAIANVYTGAHRIGLPASSDTVAAAQTL